MNNFGFLAGLAIGLAIIYGWFLNIAALMSDQVFSTGELVVRGIGVILAPLGAIMGYFF